MQHPCARRLLAGLAVAGAVLAAGAAPAYAAPNASARVVGLVLARRRTRFVA